MPTNTITKKAGSIPTNSTTAKTCSFAIVSGLEYASALQVFMKQHSELLSLEATTLERTLRALILQVPLRVKLRDK
jgi:hypothetical protein